MSRISHESRDVPTRLRPAARLAAALSVLALGVTPLPAGWASVRAARDSARSSEPNRAERQADSAGYYEGLVGSDRSTDRGRSELSLLLNGKPNEWARFSAASVANKIPWDYLQFELMADVDRVLFGVPFTTNSHGLRDRPYAVEAPEGTFRIALLGSSIDMGWGVGTDQTYENLLEDWLNAHAARRGLPRRFEVLNFAVAAYGPAQRLEAFRRKAAAFRPDLVLYSVTMLDARLSEIHLTNLLTRRLDLREDFYRRVVADAGLVETDLALDPITFELARKDLVKAKLRDCYDSIADGALGALAADCRSAGLPLACLVVPRVGKADAPEARAEAVSRHVGVAAHHAVPVLDLTAAFDAFDPAALEIAPWDDHPNAEGHRRLFLTLARSLARNPDLFESFFGVPPNGP